MGKIDDLASNALKSGLVTAEVLDRARAKVAAARPSESEAAEWLARYLIESGYLTGYQARKLLAGATRGFFLGGYRILRRLGEGGMGKVYLGSREKDGARVAIKVLPPNKAAEGGQALARFRREMDLSRRAVHPNLAQTIDVGIEGNVYFMIMEYVPGQSLYEMIKGPGGGPLRVPDAARLFIKVLDGLDAAHRANLIHRDIKPSNIMVTPDGEPKLLDLGLARGLEEEGTMTRPNIVIGTLDYASPEQLTDASKADRRSDLYSLGCTIYFTLAGQAPFEGGDLINKMFKQRMDDPDPLERFARGVPSAFAAIVRKLMAKNPADRYQTCSELQLDLSRWTDPAVSRAILGAAAESARAFRPPSPELDDDDLKLSSSGDGQGGPSVTLRELGSSEVPTAPLHKPPPPPRAALLLSESDPLFRNGERDGLAAKLFGERKWLVQWVAVSLVLIVLLVLSGLVFFR